MCQQCNPRNKIDAATTRLAKPFEEPSRTLKHLETSSKMLAAMTNRKPAKGLLVTGETHP